MTRSVAQPTWVAPSSRSRNEELLDQAGDAGQRIPPTPSTGGRGA